MFTIRRATVLATAALALTALVGIADAQPYGPGARGPVWGPGMMDSGMMMGPGASGRGAFQPMCNPSAAGFAAWRRDRLERIIKPTDAQRIKLDEFIAASNKAADTMRTSCQTDVPATAVGRMDAMEKRMDAMLQAVKTVRPALEAFYATLTDEQKAQLDANSGQRRFRHWRGRW